MEKSRIKKIIAIALVIIAFLLATIIITNSIIQSFHLVDDKYTPIMSYEAYTLSTEQKYTPISGGSYNTSSNQSSVTSNNSISSNDNSLLESSTNNLASSFLSSAVSNNSSKENISSSSSANESVSSSASYSAASKLESKAQNSKSEETTQQNEQQISVHEHKYSERVVSPSCTSKGYTFHSCECGKAYADNYKDALGHQWGDWETLSEATITSKGLQQRICSRCSAKDYKYTEKLTVDNSPNSEFAEEVVRLINEERKKNGLEPLTIDQTLMNNAYTRSTELETNFGHKRPNGEKGYMFALELGYSTVGENIAAGQNTPEEVVSAWMSSSGHRSNILNSDFTHTGVGCYMADDGWIYWAQLFGG